MVINNRESFWQTEKHYSKAMEILRESEEQLKKFNWDLVVRRAQESSELFIKIIFWLLEKDFSKIHDIGKNIYTVTDTLKEYGLDSQKLAEIVLVSQTLSSWRETSFYGDEKLSITGIFSETEGRLAVSYAQKMMSYCAIVRTKIANQLK